MEAVNVLIKNNNKILAVMRGQNDPLFPGMWALPGGAVEENETHYDTALRELSEEIGNNAVTLSGNSILIAEIEIQKQKFPIYVFEGRFNTDIPHQFISQASDIERIEWISPNTFIESLKRHNFPRDQIELFQRYLQG